MPFAPITDSQRQLLSPEFVGSLESRITTAGPGEDPPGFGTRLLLSAQQENLFVNVIGALTKPHFERNEEYRFDAATELPEALIEFRENFENSRSTYETDYLIRQAQSELVRRAILSQGSGLARFAGYGIAGLLSPENLLPVGAALKAGKIVKTAASLRGGVVVGAAAGLIEQSLAEVSLRSIQLTRTEEESKANIIGAVVFGSVLGGFAGTVSGARLKVLEDATERTLRLGEVDKKFLTDENGELLSLDDSATRGEKFWNDRTEAIQKELVEKHPDLLQMVGNDVIGGSWVKRWYSRLLARTPVLRGAISDSVVMRVTTRDLTQTALVRKSGAAEAAEQAIRAPSVEAEAALWSMHGYRAVSDVTDVYRAYKKAQPRGTSVVSAKEFFELVTMATRRVDADDVTGLPGNKWVPEGEFLKLDAATIKAIQEAVPTFRKWNDAVGRFGNDRSGHLLLSELYENSVTKTANSYVQRVYDIRKLSDVQERDDFRTLVRTWHEERGILVNEEEINGIIHKIEGTQHTIRTEVPASPFEARTLMLRDDYAIVVNGRRIALEDFLENDMRVIISRQIHQQLPRMVLARRMATPAHKKLLALTPKWEAAVTKMRAATDDVELLAAQRDLDLVRREMNDVATLEVMHGHGTAEMEELATKYTAAAVERDKFTGLANTLEDVVKAEQLAMATLVDHIAARSAFEADLALNMGKGVNPVRAVLTDLVEQADAGLTRPRVRADEEAALQKELVEARAELAEVELNQTETGLAARVQQTEKGIQDLEATLEPLTERLTEQALRGETPDPVLFDKVDQLLKDIRFLEGELAVRTVELSSSTGSTPRKRAEAEARASVARSRIADLERKLEEAKARPTLDVDQEVDRVFLAALLGRRVQGSLAPVYTAARKLIKDSEELTALSRRAKQVQGFDVAAGTARLDGMKTTNASNKLKLKDHKDMTNSATSQLFDIRTEVKGSVKSELTGDIRVTEAPRLRDDLENSQLAAESMGGQLARLRQSHVERLETLTWRRLQIDREYEDLARAFPDRKKTINKRREAAHEDLNGMIGHLTGVAYQSPSKLGAATFSGLRKGMFITKMGGMMISSIPDTAMAIFTAGFIPWAKMAVRFFRDPRFKSFSKDEIATLLIAAEMTMGNMRFAKLGGIEDLAGDGVGGLLDRGALLMSKWSGMQRWNAMNKALASVALTQKSLGVFRKLKDKEPLTGPEKQFLEISGIPDDMGVRIHEQMMQWGEPEKLYGITIRHPNTRQWTDTAAREVFEMSLVQNVHRTIITPGIGEIPLFGNSEIGRMIFQFRSFTMSATQQVLISGAQRFFTTYDMNVLHGAGGLVTMGLFTQYLKTLFNEGPEAVEEKLFKNPANWIVQAIDRSGLTGVMGDMNAIVERMTAGKIGASAITGEQISRFSSRNLASALLGPSFGLTTALPQAAQLPFKIASGEVSRSDASNMRRLLPFQNLFYVRALLDSLGPYAVTGKSQQFQDWILTDEDIEGLNEATQNLWKQPVLD